MKDQDLAWWLVENAGPVIRYRTLREIIEVDDVSLISDALENLFSSKLVQKWLNLLVPRMGYHAFHSSQPTAFENAMWKLVQLGLHAGLKELDSRTIKFRAWLAESVKNEEYERENQWKGFSELLLASFLSYAGYDDILPVRTITEQRLIVARDFVESFDSDKFYVKSSKKEWLVDPRFYINNPNGLPLVHDIQGFANSKWILNNQKWRLISERVVSVILSEGYQRLKPGYGYMKYDSSYYAIGWSVHLPNFANEPDVNEISKLLLDLERLAVFEAARRSDWFRNSMDILENTRTQEGHYRFPSAWMPEKPSGYWNGGHYMNLEDNHRKSSAIDYESTFRVLSIRKRMCSY